MCSELWISNIQSPALGVTDPCPWFLDVCFLALGKLCPVYQIINLLFISPLFHSSLTFVLHVSFMNRFFIDFFCLFFPYWAIVVYLKGSPRNLHVSILFCQAERLSSCILCIIHISPGHETKENDLLNEHI